MLPFAWKFCTRVDGTRVLEYIREVGNYQVKFPEVPVDYISPDEMRDTKLELSGKMLGI